MGERVFSKEEGVEEVPLGLYIIRGDNIAVVARWTNRSTGQLTGRRKRQSR